jgi:hypothetical protein
MGNIVSNVELGRSARVFVFRELKPDRKSLQWMLTCSFPV